MAKLIAFGDSFTYGSELSDNNSNGLYSLLTWPALLAKHLNLDYVCLAIEGCSNQTITREFFNYINNISKNDLVVINWTWIDRWDFYNIDNTSWETVRPSNNNSSTFFNKIYFKYMQSELWDKWETLKNINLILYELQHKGVQYIMSTQDNLILDNKSHTPGYIVNIQNNINNEFIWFNNQTFLDWSKTNKFKISELLHPLDNAHNKAFKYIINNYDFTK